MIKKQEPNNLFGVPKNVRWMGFVSFLNDLSSDMILPFIPVFLTQTLGASATFIGLVEGIADAAAGVLKIVGGRLSDFFNNRKLFVLAGYMLSGIAKPLLAFAQAPSHVLALRFVDRMGKGIRDAARDALISLSVKKGNLGRAFGFHRGADTLGASLGPLLAVAILPLINNDLRTLFSLSFIATMIAVICVALFVKEKKLRPLVKVMDENTTVDRFEWKYLGWPFLIFLFSATLFALARVSETFLLLYASNQGVSLILLPILYFIYNIFLAVFATPFGVLSDRIGHRNTYMIGMIAFSSVIFFFSYGAGASFNLLWILFALYGVVSALTEGVGKAVVADLVESRFRATAFGMYNACVGIAALPASLIFGILWDLQGPSQAFVFSSILSLLAFICFLYLRTFGSRYFVR